MLDNLCSWPKTRPRTSSTPDLSVPPPDGCFHLLSSGRIDAPRTTALEPGDAVGARSRQHRLSVIRCLANISLAPSRLAFVQSSEKWTTGGMKQRGERRKEESRRSPELLLPASESSPTEGRLSANCSLLGGGEQRDGGRGNDGNLYGENRSSPV